MPGSYKGNVKSARRALSSEIFCEKNMELLIQFLSNHFEYIMAINVFWVIGAIVIMVASRIRSAKTQLRQSGQKSLDKFLYNVVVLGETVLLSLTVYVFFTNLVDKKPMDDALPIFSTTEWVKDETTIYFILGNTLVSIQPNGTKRQELITTTDAIVSYHFSPHGRYILLVTESRLYQYGLNDKAVDVIESIDMASEIDGQKKGTGIISGVAWSPNNDKYCYRVTKWSKYSSTESWYLYDLRKKEKRTVNSPARLISNLVWDERGENLYYPAFKALDTSVRGNPYDVRVYKIPLANLTPGIRSGLSVSGTDAFAGIPRLAGNCVLLAGDALILWPYRATAIFLGLR